MAKDKWVTISELTGEISKLTIQLCDKEITKETKKVVTDCIQALRSECYRLRGAAGRHIKPEDL